MTVLMIFFIGEQITDIIATLPVNKVTGSDCINYRMLKLTAHTISRPLLNLFEKNPFLAFEKRPIFYLS
jgi:hypothetical protein